MSESSKSALVLYVGDEPVREFPLGGYPLEVGSGSGCDIVIHDSTVPERHLLVEENGGTVVARELGRDDAPPLRLAPGVPVQLGRHHRLVRIPSAGSPSSGRPDARTTEPIEERLAAERGLTLLVGRGASVRAYPIERRPITIGTAPRNEVMLVDRAVSARHCRIEHSPRGLLIRDLGSTNGTWVDGVRVVTAARIGAGSTVRVGRTDLTVVARGAPGDARVQGLVAESQSLLALLGDVERYARHPWPALITGESGVGKEGIARALHHRSPRAARPFVALNAAAFSPQLIESQLFGHEKGAFTGAALAHRGVFEQADGGTLFLDEVGELPLEMQARLLRVLEFPEVRRVGGELAIPVDVRLVCATHRNLRSMVAEGRFREDLFWRLARLVIHVPPLRERPEDISALARHFVAQVGGSAGRFGISDEALQVLLDQPWPGNARQLRNVIQLAAIECAGGRIESSDVERAMRRIAGPAPTRPPLPVDGDLADALAEHGGNLSAAAKALGIPRSTLRDRVRRKA